MNSSHPHVNSLQDCIIMLLMLDLSFNHPCRETQQWLTGKSWKDIFSDFCSVLVRAPALANRTPCKRHYPIGQLHLAMTNQILQRIILVNASRSSFTLKNYFLYRLINSDFLFISLQRNTNMWQINWIFRLWMKLQWTLIWNVRRSTSAGI